MNTSLLCRAEAREETEIARCWRFTWLGAQTEQTNYTTNCDDLQTDEGPARCYSQSDLPCFYNKLV